MVCFATKVCVHPRVKRTIMYRSYKHFNTTAYQRDLEAVPFHVGEVFDSVDDSHWFCNELLKAVIERHAPVKKRVIKHSQLPYMNDELRRAKNVKNMLRRKYDRCKSRDSWESFRRQRNYVTRLRKKSVRKYLAKKCDGNGKDFWKTVKPLFNNKSSGRVNNIILRENGQTVLQSKEVCALFNEHFVNIARDIGQVDTIPPGNDFETTVTRHKDHPSVKWIENNVEGKSVFDFVTVTPDVVYKKLAALNGRKATGVDNIPPRLVKAGAAQLSEPIATLFNMSVTQAVFPDMLKRAEVLPLFKKGDVSNVCNYRPVSILPCLSKTEGILIN